MRPFRERLNIPPFMARLTPLRSRLIPAAVFTGGFLLYLSTLAPSVVFGDPAEYTFVPYAWGVIHPPGYAFQTILAKLWQTLVPIGTVAWRTNLLSAAVAALGVTLVYGIVRQMGGGGGGVESGAILAAATLAVASDFWQHAIHANAHIVTAALALLALTCLLRWKASASAGWLRAFGFVAGVSIAHHPLLAFSFPAYAVFILSNLQYPISRTQLARLLSALLFFALGLTPWLYFPIRSAISPPPVIGPHDMNTLDGFVNLALARGLRVNLFHFGLGQQWQRLIVFWSLLRLQMPLLVIVLIPLGLAWLWRRDWRTGLLFTVFLAVNLAFILNTVQDVMAYFLVPLGPLAALAGLGGWGLVTGNWGLLRRQNGNYQLPITNLVSASLLLLPLFSLLYNYPRISLHDYWAADEYVDRLFARFAGKGEHAILLSDWEHLTPLWYREYVEGRSFDPADLTPVFVSGGERPWVDAVWNHIQAGPIYVVEYQPQIAAQGFRLRADAAASRLYRVLPPPATDMPAIPNPLSLGAGGQIEILGYDLGATEVRAGAIVPLTLYMRAPQAVSDILFPYAALGPYRSEWTTDSHLLTPYWMPGEIVAERFDLTVPLDAPDGEFPLRLGMANLTTGEQLPMNNEQIPNPKSQDPKSNRLSGMVELATVRVAANPAAPAARVLDGLAANFGQRVGLEAAEAWAGGRRYAAPWAAPITARAGQPIQLLLHWRALAPSETSATVFVHLLDAGNGLWAGQDYTPLGGAFPTNLWFPKWLEGQRATDPYTISVPADAPPGDYYIEAGLYGLRTIQRFPAFDRAGNLAGDRFVLGGVVVVVREEK